ncbi:MAG TPA: SCO family protein [Solirubrobacteraceae bacterium]
MADRAAVAFRRAALASLLAVAVVAVATASIARADGDPASDYLLANQVFVTSASGSLSPAQHRLVDTVAAANRAGFTIRVAIIANAADLGAVTELWRQPRPYARFLGQELRLGYKQRLLVVMPNGFGFNWPGRSSAAEYKALGKMPIKPGPDGLSDSAQAAVRRLARVPLPATTSTAAAQSTGPGPVAIILVALGGLAVLTALAIFRLRRRPARPTLGRGRRRISIPRPLPLKAHLAIVVVVVLCATGAATAVVVTHGQSGRSRNTSAIGPNGAPSASQARAVVTPPPFSWPAGRRPAPEFQLRDQSGGPVSLASYRGHPVIVTFIDPVCRNVCPLEAKVLNQAVQQMPSTQRPEILAVSVNKYADARANLLKDARKWNLVPEWRWAVGSPGQLAAVWKRYKISVSASRVKVAGKTVTSITHTAAAYIVDNSGHERALFLWPFYPQDVDHVLRQLSRQA